MTNYLINFNDVPVFVAELGKQLAPYERIAVRDAKAVERLTKTGVLSSDVDRYESDLKGVSERIGQDLELVRKAMEAVVATWHNEHDAPAEQVTQPGEVVGIPCDVCETPEECAQAGHCAKEPVAQREVTPQGTEVNVAPQTEQR